MYVLYFYTHTHTHKHTHTQTQCLSLSLCHTHLHTLLDMIDIADNSNFNKAHTHFARYN